MSRLLELAVSLVVLTLGFTLLFKYVPDADIRCRHVWLSGLVTVVLFTVGKTAIGAYLGHARVGSAYGAAGSMVVLLVWVYYSALIVFFGAEFTQAWATQHGGVAPQPHAVSGAAPQTKGEAAGRRCVALAGDVGDERFCQQAVCDTVRELGRLDILVNNAAEQHPQEGLEKITSEQLERTFRTNVFSYFYMTKAALSHLRDGSAVINTTSVTASRGSAHLLDYAATKGAIVAFTRSLAKALVARGIRVNGVAPGPIWTPLVPSTFPADRVAAFGAAVPMQRAGQPEEVVPSYIFLASDDASYMTGQVLHPKAARWSVGEGRYTHGLNLLHLAERSQDNLLSLKDGRCLTPEDMLEFFHVGLGLQLSTE